MSATAKVTLSVRCSGLGTAVKPAPFCVVLQRNRKGKWIELGRSEKLPNDTSPTWKKGFAVEYRFAERQVLRVEVFDGKMLLGWVEPALGAIVSRPGKEYRYKARLNDGQGTLFIRCEEMTEAMEPTFLDYIQGGTVMNFSVAVDFSASNGNPNEPNTLHSKLQPENQYTTAIRAVGEVIQDYDTDNKYPAFGFGARVPPDFEVSQDFNLTLDPDNPFCLGVDGILATYHSAMQRLRPNGPTHFAPTIRKVADLARKFADDGRQYFVHLILTDGGSTDMIESISAIIEASDLPLSFVIIGVGDGDFEAMKQLDSDEKLLTNGNATAHRDIVQFVEMQRFLGDEGQWNKADLASEVLYEIPAQLVGWMKSKGIKPVV